MFYKKMKDTYVLRLEIGEEIVESLKSFLRQTEVRSGYVTGIGACDYARVGVYKVAEKRYYETEFRGDNIPCWQCIHHERGRICTCPYQHG